ncbi:MAG: RHS repeat-associated core domain-containing protein [Gammaproteobacteria bacterium]|nr:RHS repeat-associated core domain-containing protein [Gammaproteobacteria bacterium]
MTDGDKGPTEYFYLGSKLIAKENQVATTEDTPGYTGHLEDDDLQLTYMQARYYDPIIGRFYSNDPVDMLGHMQRGNPTMGFNRYAYVNNNPYKYTDPDGEFLFLLPLLGAALGGYSAYQGATDLGLTGEARTAATLGGVLAGGISGGVTALGTKAAQVVVTQSAVKESIGVAGKLASSMITGGASKAGGQAVADATSDKQNGQPVDIDTNKVGAKFAEGMGDGLMAALPGATVVGKGPLVEKTMDAVGVAISVTLEEQER